MFIQVLDILGTIAFAISGVLVAMNKKMDPFGVFIIAFVTAVGGGTLRDILIRATPVFWMTDITFILVISLSTVFAVLFRNYLKHLRRSLFLFDTIGIGLYTVIGIEKGLAADLHPIVCVTLGTMSACFGGVIRDILCSEIPVIFRKEIYATACILGGCVYFLLQSVVNDSNIIFLISCVIVIVARLLAVIFKVTLPNFYVDKK